jgi:phosphatidate cytidylyltransferase
VLCVFIVNAVAAPGLTPVDCVVIGLVAGSLGVLGDLSESLLKRSFGVKDSGKIMPGHGGLLDRIDSVLFVCPSLFVYLWIVKGV